MKKINILFLFLKNRYKRNYYRNYKNKENMKHFYLFFIIILLISKQSESLKTENYCKRINNNKCSTYECGKYFCSVDKTTCDSLFQFVKKYSKKSNTVEKKKLNIYTQFVDDIKRCKTKINQNLWSHRLKVG